MAENNFKLSASDSVGLIGEGIHTRFVVNAERFQNKTNRRFKENESCYSFRFYV